MFAILVETQSNFGGGNHMMWGVLLKKSFVKAYLAFMQTYLLFV